MVSFTTRGSVGKLEWVWPETITSCRPHSLGQFSSSEDTAVPVPLLLGRAER